MDNSRFNKFPAVAVSGFTCYSGWAAISAEIRTALMAIKKNKKIIAVEIYPGAFQDDICSHLQMHFHVDYVFSVHEIYKDEHQCRTFIKGDPRLICVPESTRQVNYDPLRRLCIGISKIGTSQAI